MTDDPSAEPRTARHCWEFQRVGEPLVRAEYPLEHPSRGQALIRVHACGVCHTDLGYLYDGIPTRHGLPLTLGHEVVGRVESVGAEVDPSLRGATVVIPAVTPCATCDLCKSGHGSICRKQVFLGADVHGGFASHVLASANGLCRVDTDHLQSSGVNVVDLSVLADAITTPYQAIVRSGLAAGELAIFVGAGGVGGFGVQIAAALGAHAIALDIDDDRLERLTDFGANKTWNVRGADSRRLRSEIQQYAKAHGLSGYCWKIFETSGVLAGQQLAYGLLTHGSHLSIIGYTSDQVTVRLSNLMAFDATARGNWGCHPDLYPAALGLVLSGQIKISPFVEHRPMSRINETFEDLRAHRISRRPVLIADFA